MKVSQVGSGTAGSSARRADKTGKGKGSFSAHLKKYMEVDGPAAADAPTTVASVDGLLALQGATEDEGGGHEARRRMLQRGEEILDRLEEIRHDLLLGMVPKAKLAELAQMMRAKRESGVDARLAAVLDEIELRAEIEMAKLSRRP